LSVNVAATTVTATFTLNTFTLTVTPAGAGSGTVTSAPAGINCGVDCSEVYTSAQSVTLTAVAAGGSTFTGWSGEGCSGTGTCVVAMSQARNVTATFVPNFALTVNVTQAAGQGSVTSAPAGITTCTMAGCTASYASGTSVTLTASLGTAASVTWGATQCDSNPTALTCTLSMSAARTVDVTFNP